jgi:phenylpropionate dioxygenase-like ring-hydroxylating dioxygenase large terminal subunit
MTRNLFPDFADLWVPLGLARDIVAGRPAPFVAGGERVVLFRDAAGQLAGLLDRCPHRGVALSLGRVDRGVLVCPFHGWRFDGLGRCLHVPWNPDARLDQLSATALPVREAGGLVWLFTGREAVDEPMVPESLLQGGLRLMAQHFDWAVHWTRAMENMLDTPHLPFVHGRSIGKALRGRTHEKMDMVWTQTAFGALSTAIRAGEAPRTALRYHFPNMMELAIDPGGRVMRLFAVCMPTTDGRTRLTIYTARNFARPRLFDPLFARVNARIALEDKAIVESALPAQVPPAAEEQSVASDAPTLAFRKIWFSRIKSGG